MKNIFTILALLAGTVCLGQNLVPNGDFEQYIACPKSISQIDSATYWFNPTLGMAPHLGGTPDYFNKCATEFSQVSVPDNYFGHQAAQHGDAYGGVFCRIFTVNNYREYMETPLLSPLTAGICYHFEMYINLADIARYTSDAIGAYFSDTAVRNVASDSMLPFTPQVINNPGNFPDTAHWTLVAGEFTAQGNENYLIIGNFNNDTNTALNFVNSATLYPEAYFLIDNISLVECASIGVEKLSTNKNIKPYPNPFSAQLTFSLADNEQTTVSLYDFLGQQILQQTFLNTTTINTEQLAGGIYFYELRNDKGGIKKGKVVKQ